MRPLVRSCAVLLGCREALRHVNGRTSSLSRVLCVNLDISHHDVATEGTATYRLQNPGANVCLASVAAVSGDKDNRLLRVNRVDFAMSAIGPLTLQQQTCCLAIDLLVPSVIQVPKLKLPIMRYELSDFERSVIKPMLPNKPRGIPRVDDRRVP